MALECFSPVELLAIRYTLSGGLLLAGAKLTGAHLPRGRELWSTALFGVITIGTGTGSLVFAEQWIPSGLAALFVSTSPFWMVGIEALAPRGERLHAPTVRGMLVGIAGVAFLVAPIGSRSDFGAARTVAGAFLLLQFGCVGWAAGSIAQRKQNTKAHPFVAGAVQQLATGLVYMIPAMVRHDPIRWSWRGAAATGYLVLFGSIVGYSAYSFAMNRLPVAVASIYTYVNPVVAVILGWLIYREPFGPREAVAMTVIFLGVWLVKRASIPVQKLSAESAAESGQYGE